MPLVSEQICVSNILYPLFFTPSINLLPEFKRRGKALVQLLEVDIFLGLLRWKSE